ncbi:MAG TPA: hypothetical protein VK364_02160 [Hymenobacter sp.]|nr:hypothetical protein [Hymenobacter sp.]
MSEKVIAIYCFLDDFFQETRHAGSIKPQAQFKVSDAIVLTTAIISARFFGGNQASAMRYMADKQGVVMLEKSAFNRRLHRLAHTLSTLFYYLADFFKALNISGQYVMDSFPVAVCDNIRISRSRLVGARSIVARLPPNDDFSLVFAFNSSPRWTNSSFNFLSCPARMSM